MARKKSPRMRRVVWLSLLLIAALGAYFIFQYTMSQSVSKVYTQYTLVEYEHNHSNIQALTTSPADIIFIATPQGVFALRDFNHDYVIDKEFTIPSLSEPTGVAYYAGNLYVKNATTIVRISEIDSHTGLPPKPVVTAANETIEGLLWQSHQPHDKTASGVLFANQSSLVLRNKTIARFRDEFKIARLLPDNSALIVTKEDKINRVMPVSTS